MLGIKPNLTNISHFLSITGIFLQLMSTPALFWQLTSQRFPSTSVLACASSSAPSESNMDLAFPKFRVSIIWSIISVVIAFYSLFLHLFDSQKMTFHLLSANFFGSVFFLISIGIYTNVRKTILQCEISTLNDVDHWAFRISWSGLGLQIFSFTFGTLQSYFYEDIEIYEEEYGADSYDEYI